MSITELGLFEKGTKEHVRFIYKGNISCEDLWEVPVKGLDTIYKKLMTEKKSIVEDSLLTENTKADNTLLLKLDIVKRVFEVKKNAADSQLLSKKNKEKKEALLTLLEQKRLEALSLKSPKEIQKMIDEL